MTIPASHFPVELPPAFLGVAQSATGKLWRDRLDARGAARALAIAQRYHLPEMLAPQLKPLAPPDTLQAALKSCRLFVEHPIARMTGLCALIRRATPA